MPNNPPLNESAATAAAEFPSKDDELVGRVGSFYPWPLPDDDVRLALARCYADGSWGRYHGPHAQQLKDALSAMHGVEHVTLCSSGTVAVELALRGLKVGPGDEVVLAGYDFSGNFRAIEAVGARPVLVDIDPRTWCLDPVRLSDAISRQTRAIVVSHLHGGLADMRAIMQFAAAHELSVMEDACQAPGALVQGRMAGSWGDAGVLSFGGSKLLTAGRGGAVVTRRGDVHQRIKVFSERGNQAFPLSELQAAVLLPQLRRLDERNRQRRTAVAQVLTATANVSALRPLENRAGDEPRYYKLAWLFEPSAPHLFSEREAFLVKAQSAQIPIDAGFRGFTRRGGRRCRVAGDLSHSARAAQGAVLLHHPVLLAGDSELSAMIDRLQTLLRERGGES